MRRCGASPLLPALLITLLVHLSLEVESGHPNGSDHNDKSSLYVLALAPQPDSRYSVGWDGGPGLIPAARLAVEQINNRTDILPDHELRLIEEDSGCFITSRTLIGYTRSVLHGERNVVAAIGPGCSPAAVDLGRLSNADRVPFVQLTIASSPELGSRTEYPYTFATISASNEFVLALLSLMELNNWNRISVVFEGNSVFHKAVVGFLEEEFKIKNKSVSSFAMFETYFPLEQLIQARNTIVVVLGTRALARKLLCMAFRHERKLTYPVYQWVFIVRTFSDFFEDEFCTLSEYHSALENSIFLEYNLETTDKVNRTVSGLTYNEYTQALIPKISEYETETGLNITTDFLHGLVFSTVYHDAVWALALSLDDVIKTSDLDLSDYRPGVNRTIPDLIKDSLYGVEFKGVSGDINFNRATGHASSVITFSQVRGNQSMVFIHFYHNRIIRNLSNSIRIEDSFQEVFVVIATPIGVVIMLVAFAELIVIVFFHTFTFVYRNEKSIKRSSVHLTHIIFFGCYLLIIETVLYCISGLFKIENQTAGNVICNIHLWLFSIAASLIIATVCVKTWRLYRIFIHYMRPGGLIISDPVLAIVIFVIQIPLVFGLIFISAFFPSEWRITQSHSIDSEGKPILRMEAICANSWQLGLLQSHYMILLLCALLLTLVNSKKITKMYRTTKSTTFIVYTHVFTFPFVFAIRIIAEYEEWTFYAAYLVDCIGAIFFVFTCIIFLLVPPTIPTLREKLGCSVNKDMFYFVTK